MPESRESLNELEARESQEVVWLLGSRRDHSGRLVHWEAGEVI